MAKSDKNIEQPAIATDTIRLSADETRALVRAANAKGIPITHHCACTLEGLGLMESKNIPGVDKKEEIAEVWKQIREHAKAEEIYNVERDLERLERLHNATKEKQVGYVLTDLGKKVISGISVRLNRQFTGVNC